MRRCGIVLAFALLVSVTPAHAKSAQDDDEGVLTEEQEQLLPAESVRWAKSAVVKAQTEAAKLQNKIRTAKTPADRDLLQKQLEAYTLAGQYYQSYVDYTAARELAYKKTLAVNEALQNDKPAADLRAQLVAQNTILQAAVAAMQEAEDAYRSAVGDRLLDPISAVTELYARRNGGEKPE